jgi:alpha-ketoglutarate-dependent taurine dioxygenase
MSYAFSLQAHVPHEGQLKVTRLQPTFGAEVEGLDLREPLTPELRDEVRALIIKHKVIFLRDQHITREQQLAFATQFGPPVIHPLQKLKETQRKEDLPQGMHTIVPPTAEYGHIPKRRTWHSDGSWTYPVAFASFLRGVEVPEVGGDTIWADAGAIYRGLPDRLKAKLEGLYVTHEYKELALSGISHPIVAHPAVINHSETGEDLLYVDFIMHPWIVGWDRADSEALLSEIYEEVLRPEYHLRLKWKKGTLAIWDNRSTLHTAIHDYGDFPRRVERVVVGSNDVPSRDPSKRFVLPA